MTKATHNGNCQCCGNVQAVNAKTQKLAKHGYTVDWGFFNGVCRGAESLPLQIDRTITDETITALNEYAAEMAALTVDQVEHVFVEMREKCKRVWGKINRWTEKMDAEQYAAHIAGQKWPTSWEEKQMAAHRKMQRQGEMAAKQAADLGRMADDIHGTALIERAAETPLNGKFFKSYREAFYFAEQLKADGKRDVRQRRTSQGYASSFKVTWRG